MNASKKRRRGVPAAAWLLAFVVSCPAWCQTGNRYLAAVKTFADNVLAHGRDVYGPRHTPLFVDGLNVDTGEPVKWKTGEREWVISNLANQQNLFRTLDGLSILTGDRKYRAAAEEATRFALVNLREQGLLLWGGHRAYDATADAPYKFSSHELKSTYPYYELMWRVDPAATREVIEAIWNAHVIDWSNLDFNRHGSPKPAGEMWNRPYKGGPVFFTGKGLTFVNAGSDLYYAAAILGKLTGEEAPLAWSKRLALRYVETRDPKTGIGGYQFSQIAADRAAAHFGEDFPGRQVTESRILRGAPPAAPRICQLALAEALGERGKEFARWAREELTAWGKSAYRARDNAFIPMLTDGTSLEGYVFKKDGYYGSKGGTMRASAAQPSHLWAYALAWRLTGDPFMWEMARSIARGNGFGDIGAAGAKPRLNPDTGNAEGAALMAFLELHRKSGRSEFLALARCIGDNIIATRLNKGYFTGSPRHPYAKFDAPESLVLLHLAAALEGKTGAVPAWMGGGGFFHAVYAYPRKGRDGRIYDSEIYERTRASARVFPGKDWARSTPEEQGIDGARLREAVDYLARNAGRDGVRQLVIVRHGRIVWAGEDIDAVHGTWSMTKSFTSTMLGLLIDDGKTTLEARAAEYHPELARDYPDLRLRHFASMTSGYRAAGDEPKGSYRHGPSSTPFLPSTPNFTPPGSKFQYWDSAMNEFAHVLTRIAGESLDALFRRRIADPIGMPEGSWRWPDLGMVNGLKVNGGAGNNGASMHISARQAARFGLLFLAEGNWNGRQLISREWVRDATRPHPPSGSPAGSGDYGFNWWCNGTGSGGQRKWPSAPARTFAALGHNNNRLYVIPEWDMVVVRLGLDQGDKTMGDDVYDKFFSLAARAIEPDGL